MPDLILFGAYEDIGQRRRGRKSLRGLRRSPRATTVHGYAEGTERLSRFFVGHCQLRSGLLVVGRRLALSAVAYFAAG